MICHHLVEKRRNRQQMGLANANPIFCEMADRLFERLDYILLKPTKILIYGWQSAYASSCLQERYPNAIIQVITGYEQLSQLPENSINLVISNAALEWENEPKQVLQAFHRILAHEGLLHFTTLGPDTAIELKQSFAAVDDYPHAHTFTDMHHIGDCLKKLAFQDPVVDMEILTLAYDRLDELFKDLKSAAATNADMDRRKGLMTQNQWQRMLAAYEQFKTEDYFPFTLEIIYGHAWKVNRQEVGVPLDKITVRR